MLRARERGIFESRKFCGGFPEDWGDFGRFRGSGELEEIMIWNESLSGNNGCGIWKN
jgi:hypothetical protein